MQSMKICTTMCLKSWQFRSTPPQEENHEDSNLKATTPFNGVDLSARLWGDRGNKNGDFS
jgi:hypothetical protein